MTAVLSSLSLSNVRNHVELTLDLGQTTVVLGPNGSGKTAVLEAVSLLSLANSWKTDRDSELVRWGEEFARVTAPEREIVIQRSPAYKRYRIDGISKRLNDILGTLPTVLFQPDDSALIHGSPSDRRRLLDRLLSQTEPGYAKALAHVQKVVKQRNKLLKQLQEGEGDRLQLSYWSEQLAESASLIRKARSWAVTIMQDYAARIFAELIPDGLPVTIYYKASPKEEIEDIGAHLAAHEHTEIAAGITLYGPHREDLVFHYGPHLASEALSRGQTRALVLACKLAELAITEERLETRPLLLLDDIFAEFDAVRRHKIFDVIKGYQTILTVTDLHGLEKELPKGFVTKEL